MQDGAEMSANNRNSRDSLIYPALIRDGVSMAPCLRDRPRLSTDVDQNHARKEVSMKSMKRIFSGLLAVVAILATLSLSLACAQGERNSNSEIETSGDSHRSFHQALGDASITASVKLALAFERGVRAMDIDVDTDRGTVTLHGEVRSQAERQLAVKVTEDVSGVKEVVDRIHVRS
jgi:osmotically-inducible protein OsmY